VWVADITYLWTVEGWLYLAAVMDLCSRKIVGWALSSSLKTDLVKEALRQAWLSRRPGPGLLHHSDRGTQYASSAFQALLLNYRMTASMSGPGHCYDNAAMESFWSTLKTEALHRLQLHSAYDARQAVFDYIETFYNPKRPHSSLDYRSPNQYEHDITHRNAPSLL
jgi:putative transposase